MSYFKKLVSKAELLGINECGDRWIGVAPGGWPQEEATGHINTTLTATHVSHNIHQKYIATMGHWAFYVVHILHLIV